jgi:hypothetical protein
VEGRRAHYWQVRRHNGPDGARCSGYATAPVPVLASQPPAVLDDRPPPEGAQPDVIAAYLEAGWSVDASGEWHEPGRSWW